MSLLRLGLGLGLKAGWHKSNKDLLCVSVSYSSSAISNQKKQLVPGGGLIVSCSSAAAADEASGIGDGNSKKVAVVSGTTARARRLLKIREEKRKREYDRVHNYPGWAK